MNKRYLGRLERLHRFVKALPHDDRHNFRMDIWADGLMPGRCGTTACLAGWGATDPWAKRQGFILEKRRSGSVKPVMRVKEKTIGSGVYACMIFYGLDVSEADYLFAMLGLHTSRHQALRRLARFIDRARQLPNHTSVVVTPKNSDPRLRPLPRAP